MGSRSRRREGTKTKDEDDIEDPSLKRTLCRHWIAGACDRGDRCGFAHGKQEKGQPIPEEYLPVKNSKGRNPNKHKEGGKYGKGPENYNEYGGQNDKGKAGKGRRGSFQGKIIDKGKELQQRGRGAKERRNSRSRTRDAGRRDNRDEESETEKGRSPGGTRHMGRPEDHRTSRDVEQIRLLLERTNRLTKENKELKAENKELQQESVEKDRENARLRYDNEDMGPNLREKELRDDGGPKKRRR